MAMTDKVEKQEPVPDLSPGAELSGVLAERPVSFGFPVTDGDTLQFDVFSIADPGESMALLGIVRRWRRNRYELIPFRRDVVLGVAGTIQTIRFPLVNGELVSCMAWLTGTTTRTTYGRVFVRAKIQRDSNPITPSFILFQDYVSSLGFASFPGGRIITAPEMHLVPQENWHITDPGAGNEITQVVPVNQYWDIEHIYLEFVASGVAGNRLPHFFVMTGAAEVLNRWIVTTNITAGLTAIIQWEKSPQSTISSGVMAATQVTGLNTWAVFALNTLQLSGLLLEQFQSTTIAIDVGDAYQNIYLKIRRWLFPDLNAF